MSTPPVSDQLRAIYELRGRVEYAEPVDMPDPSLDRKFAVLSRTVSEALPCEAYLDAGCGDGRYLSALPSLGPLPARVVGADIAESILDTARRACARSGVPAKLVRANLEDLPFPDASFDLILCTQVLEHVLDPARGFRELARVAMPGGKLVLSTDNRRALITRTLNGPRWLLSRSLGRQRARVRLKFPHFSFTRREIEDVADRSGFEVEEIRTFRFCLVGAPPALTRLFNRVDQLLPDVGIGDVLLLVARRRPT